ncbi:MAG: hypothetical protein PHG66_04400 [Candidatus Colwellbacteria bacterium]|nr:hypothetical protein [Candidatus Colwellbacteria bacterium]
MDPDDFEFVVNTDANIVRASKPPTRPPAIKPMEVIHEIIEQPSIDPSEEEHKRLFSKIHSSEKGVTEMKRSDEDKIKSEISSFDNMPTLFAGINTSTFGMSSYKVKNPFLKIAEVAKNSTTSWEDRTQAIRYMQRIPHIHREKHCIECTISIITDEQYPLEARYHFFSNNEKIIKLDYEIVNACHHYYFFNFEKFRSPLLYRILSAQYLLSQFPVGTYDMEGVQSFLINIAKDTNTEINYRAECADILDRIGYGDAKEIGTNTIIELGELYTDNKRKTIYTNMQNVHDLSVTKQVIDTLRNLIKMTKTERNSEEVYNSITDIKVHYSPTEAGVTKEELAKKREAIVEVFQRIIIDTSRYEGLPMSEIMMLVWEKIATSENRRELEKRLVDEMYEMHQTCSTGHLSRLINVLSGFYDDIQPVKISYKEQLRSNVFARVSSAIRTLGQHEQEEITTEMTSDSKPCIEDFLFSYNPRDELHDEFVKGEYVSEEEFEEIYKKSINDFFGYKNESDKQE